MYMSKTIKCRCSAQTYWPRGFLPKSTGDYRAAPTCSGKTTKRHKYDQFMTIFSKIWLSFQNMTILSNMTISHKIWLFMTTELRRESRGSNLEGDFRLISTTASREKKFPKHIFPSPNYHYLFSFIAIIYRWVIARSAQARYIENRVGIIMSNPIMSNLVRSNLNVEYMKMWKSDSGNGRIWKCENRNTEIRCSLRTNERMGSLS